MRYGAFGVLLVVSWMSSGVFGGAPEGDPPAELVSLVEIATGDHLLTTPASGGIILDGEEHRFELTGFDSIDNGTGEETPALIGVFADESGFVVLPVDYEKGRLEGVVILILDGDEFVDQSADSHEIEREPDGPGQEDGVCFGAHGTLIGDGSEIVYSLAIDVSAGTSTFRIEGDTAYLNGDLGSITYRQVSYLIENHPEVSRLVFEDVPGSVHDEVNVQTGRLIRGAGYTTELCANSVVSSGGVDLFLAGEKRIIADGARIGVHSWGDPAGEIVPTEIE